MRPLLTGASGFVGSYILRQLLTRQCETAILVRPGSDLWRIQDLLPRATLVEGDLAALDAATPDILRFAPDTLIHAAWYGVGNAHRNEPEQMSRNLSGTAALMQLAARAGCRKCVALGSQAEYGPQNRVLHETAPTCPTTSYGLAKLCACVLSRHLAEQTGMRFAWMRIFSTYGPKDHVEWMIPGLVRSLCRRERPALTAGQQQWDYLYVEDAAEAICQVAETPGAEGIFNLGSGQTQSIRRIAEQIRDLIDPGLPLGFGEVPYRGDQVMHLQADIARLTEATGWTPRTPLAEGLARTVEYCRLSLRESTAAFAERKATVATQAEGAAA